MRRWRRARSGLALLLVLGVSSAGAQATRVGCGPAVGGCGPAMVGIPGGVVGPPTITGLVPATVAHNTGFYTIEIDGSGYTAATTVQVNGTNNAYGWAYVSPTQMTFNLQSNNYPAGTVTITTTTGAQVSNGYTLTLT